MPHRQHDTTLKLYPGLAAQAEPDPEKEPAGPMERAVSDLDAAVTSFRSRCVTIPFGRRASSQSGERQRVQLATVK